MSLQDITHTTFSSKTKQKESNSTHGSVYVCLYQMCNICLLSTYESVVCLHTYNNIYCNLHWSVISNRHDMSSIIFRKKWLSACAVMFGHGVALQSRSSICCSGRHAPSFLCQQLSSWFYSLWSEDCVWLCAPKMQQRWLDPPIYTHWKLKDNSALLQPQGLFSLFQESPSFLWITITLYSPS